MTSRRSLFHYSLMLSGKNLNFREIPIIDESYVKGKRIISQTMAVFGRNNSPVTISTILFDLDNTLIGTRKGDSLTCRKLAEELTQQYGIPQETSTKITTNYLKSFRKCPDNPSYDLDIWRKLLWSKALGDNYSYLTTVIYERWLQMRYIYLALTPDTVSMLCQLRKKYLVGLITNGPSNAQWEKVQKLSLSQYFDLILVSGDLPWEKPEARIFEEACRCLRVRPDECIMIGDKIETDIVGGIQAGLAGTVWIPTNDKPRLSAGDPKPDVTIKHVTHLLGVLNRGPGAPELEDSSSNASDGS